VCIALTQDNYKADIFGICANLLKPIIVSLYSVFQTIDALHLTNPET